MEKKLWRIIEKLRGAVEVRDYKRMVLPLVFLRYADVVFSKRMAEISKMKHFSGEVLPEFFNGFEAATTGVFLPEDARWEYLVRSATSSRSSLAERLDAALSSVRETNPSLADVFDDGVYEMAGMEAQNLAQLVLEIDNVFSDFDADNSRVDVFGTVYQYLLRKFSAKETRGKGKGEFYTPPEVVSLILREISELGFGSIAGKIYEPCVGTGSMILPLESQGDFQVFAQENERESYRLSKMNFLLHGISADVRFGDTLKNDAFSDLEADFVLANPPFNQRTSFSKNANFSWLFHCLSHLSDSGVAAVVLPGTVLSGEEFIAEREKLISLGALSEVILLPLDAFSGAEVFSTILILKKNAKFEKILLKDFRSASDFEKAAFEAGVEVSDVLETKNKSLFIGDYLMMQSVSIDSSQLIEKEINLRKAELSKLEKALEHARKAEVSGRVSDFLEKCEVCSGGKDEIAIDLVHVGRDKRFRVIAAPEKVPSGYTLFKLRVGAPVLAEYLKTVFESPEFGTQAAFFASGGRGELMAKNFLELKIQSTRQVQEF